MERIFKEYLFSKGIFVSESKSEHNFSALFALANRFAIRIVSGGELASKAHIAFASEMLGQYVPEAFYRGFPDSVREMTKEQLLFDQLLHYTVTYGFGDFSSPGHSVFEADFERIAFKEDAQIRKFVILSESDAEKKLCELVADMLLSSRPLSEKQFAVLLGVITTYGYKPERFECKDTVIRLLCETRNTAYAEFLSLSDVIKLVDHINYNEYKNDNLKKLNLRNKDRKFITAAINLVFEKGNANIRDCFERKALWNGLLHHLHYKAPCEEIAEFVNLMRGRENNSVYSQFERKMLLRDIKGAAQCLRAGKGSGALYRKLDYILSRAESDEEVDFVISSLGAANSVILIQLLYRYFIPQKTARTFVFSKHNKMKVHEETEEEISRRKSIIADAVVEKCKNAILSKLRERLSCRLGKVYISPEMYKVAVPLGESTSNAGYGVLPKGSRIPIGEFKKIRAFTYWEKVDDIDLSVIGITDDGKEEEFSWRNMFLKQGDSITFSGDQTSGYEGGSEFFDIDAAKFLKSHPNIKMLVFANNVFSGDNFSECICRAGYMLRDKDDSGEIFEPKTVKSSFVINAESTFAYLFGIDLRKNEFVWLNAARDSSLRIAGESSLSFLERYFVSTEVLSVGKLFEMLATEISETPEASDLIVSDTVEEISSKEVIRSSDFERIASFLN